jgi:photosystem II stability/assembly factor-like uncharacterized protein
LKRIGDNRTTFGGLRSVTAAKAWTIVDRRARRRAGGGVAASETWAIVAGNHFEPTSRLIASTQARAIVTGSSLGGNHRNGSGLAIGQRGVGREQQCNSHGGRHQMAKHGNSFHGPTRPDQIALNGPRVFTGRRRAHRHSLNPALHLEFRNRSGNLAETSRFSGIWNARAPNQGRLNLDTPPGCRVQLTKEIEMKQCVMGVVVAFVVGMFAGSGKAEAPKPIYSGEWITISDALLADLEKDHPKSKDKFATMTAGISVDRTNGDVYLLANNIGICKSTDQGKTFSLVSGKTITGRFETGWGLNIDPAGGRLMCFTIYGSAGYSPDAGKTWQQSKVGHLDFGSVDWSDTGKAMLAIGHESGGKLLFSTDAGQVWKTLGKNYSATGMFDSKTLLSFTKTEGLVRSADAGETWAKASDEKLSAPAMVEFKGIGYWLGENGLLVSKDKGVTWAIAAPVPKGASLGPMFGADENHMVVGTPDGLYESKDGGKTWAMAAPLAPKIKIQKAPLWANYGWDPIHNIFYASQMMEPAYQFVAK